MPWLREHVRVVLEVMADLGVLLRLEQRLELREARVAIELVGRAGVVVPQRQIGRVARRDGERHADDLRLHVFEAGGLGVEGEQLGGLELLQPVGELRLGGDGFVVARRGRDDLRAIADAGGGRRAGDDRLAAGGGRVRRGALPAGAPPSSCLSSERSSSRVYSARSASTSGGWRLSCSQRHRQRHVGADGRELARQLERRRGRRAGSRPPCRSTLAASATSASSVEYLPSHLAAVFGPTLSMPGMLSELSPTSAR